MGLNGAPKSEGGEKQARNRLNRLMEETNDRGDSAGNWSLLHHIWDHFDTEWHEARVDEFKGQNELTGVQQADRTKYIDSIEPNRIRDYINMTIEATHSEMGTANEEEQRELRQIIHKLELLRVKLSTP